MNLCLPPGWSELGTELQQPYMQALSYFLQQERAKGKTIYPAQHEIFTAFKLTTLAQTKVVILGQDPYHGPGQAHGLSFSVPSHIKIPPSLHNIYTELHNDLNIPLNTHGCLHNWAQQGVFLLNSVLTVEKQRPGSHQHQGWERFTDRVISLLSTLQPKLIFVLWGKYAHSKTRLIDKRHVILTAPHPSPLSAYRGFFGCRHFSKINDKLQSWQAATINWSV